jgi:hypothetical protein
LTAETEQNALGKRDDLRIEGTNDERDTTELLWTIEVKVGSGFHSSSDLQDPTSESDAHQIRNYDDWLSQQTATFRAGFVLARTDVKEDIPPDLRMPWTCLRWAELAQIVEHLLRGGELPPVETFLASHFVGFVRDALWQEVPDAMDRTIDFDDIALMRAVFMLGDRCRARVDALVSPLVQELKDAGLSQGGTGHQSKLFEPSKRNVVWQSLGGPGSIRPPYIYAGVVSERGADVAVWLETTSTFELKPKIRSLVQEKLPDLQRRNPNWHFLEPDESNSWELELRIPIESLLAEKEPGSRVTQFVRSAFTDLKETGLMNAIQATLSAPQ